MAQARDASHGVGVASAWFEANGDLKATNEERDEGQGVSGRRPSFFFFFFFGKLSIYQEKVLVAAP